MFYKMYKTPIIQISNGKLSSIFKFNIIFIIFRRGRTDAGLRANLLAIANSENRINYIKCLLENQQVTPKHRWTKIRPDPRFPDQNLETPMFAIGATKPISSKRPDFYTSLLAAWAPPMMQAYQQIAYPRDQTRMQSDSFLSDVINSKIGCPYPSMASHFGK